MSEYLIQSETLTGIADAIREKAKVSGQIQVSDMASKIRTLSGGGIEPITAYKSVTASQFQNNTEIEAADLPGVTTLGNYAFSGCSALKSVNLPAVEVVSASCFQNSAALEVVDLGAATNIGYNALNGCSALKALIIRTDSVCSIASNTLTGSGIAKGTGYAYVPAVLVDSYKANSAWKTYAARVRAKEDYPEITGG